MNKIITIIAILAIIFLAGLLFFGNEDAQLGETGIVVAGITGMPASPDQGEIGDVVLSTERLELHSEADGWTDVTTDQKQFSLLSLAEDNRTMFWSSAGVPSRTYDKIRMTVSDVTIEDDSGTTTNAILPADTVTIETDVLVTANGTSSLVFNVDVSQSLLTAEDGTYVFAPVVVAEVREGVTAVITADDSLEVAGGTVNATVTVGMDLSGESKPDFAVNPNTTINLDTNGAIVTDDETGTSTDKEEVDEEVSTPSEVN